MTETIVVDSHHHFWDPARREYPWMAGEALDPIRRPFRPDDLRPHLEATGVDATVLVQTVSSVEETREFMATAAATPFVAGVVGWVDLTDPAVGETLAELKARPDGPMLVGIRHQVHDEPDENWLLRSNVLDGLRAVQNAGLVYDLLLRPREIEAGVQAARSFPDLRFVVDHLAKPPIASGELVPWSTLMAPFADLPNVACKLSGMATEADWASWTPADLQPYVARVMDLFGDDRVMFGSDWPVCLLAASYEQVFRALETALGPIGEATRARIFGGNAVRWYELGV
jgi:L-fuconolactonase